MKFIELTLYYTNKKILVNLDGVSRITPESDGGCKIWFLYFGSTVENSHRVKENYEEIKKMLTFGTINANWQPWSCTFTETTPMARGSYTSTKPKESDI